MEFVHSLAVLAILSIFGISVCLSCDTTKIQRCIATLPGLAAQNTDSGVLCREAKKAMDCLQRETKSCPESMKSMLDMAKQNLDMSVKQCNDPVSVETMGNMEGCEQQKLIECTQPMNKPGQPKTESCRNIAKVKTCLKDFEDGCKSTYFVDLVKTQGEMLDQLADMCESEGYSTPEEKENDNRATVKVTVTGKTTKAAASCTDLQLRQCFMDIHSKGQEMSTTCLKVGKAKSCLAAFKESCDDETLLEQASRRGRSLDESVEKCKSEGHSIACFQPKVVGPCKAASPGYFYDVTTGRCQEFTYGGCEGNANNFGSLEDCTKQCGDDNNSGGTLKPAIFTLLASVLLVLRR